MKNETKNFIKKWVELIGIASIVIYTWQGLELMFLGEIRPRAIDTIIAIPIIIALYILYNKYILEDECNKNTEELEVMEEN